MENIIVLVAIVLQSMIICGIFMVQINHFKLLRELSETVPDRKVLEEIKEQLAVIAARPSTDPEKKWEALKFAFSPPARAANERTRAS